MALIRTEMIEYTPPIVLELFDYDLVGGDDYMGRAVIHVIRKQ